MANKKCGNNIEAGTKAGEDDCVSFEDKMQKLMAELVEQFDESERLEKEIKGNLKSIGF